MLTPEKQELHRRKPRIYLDRAYEKAHSDFLHDKLFPALDAAQRLIVISTPSVFDTIRDAKGESPNWLVQEIAHFFADQPTDQPPRPIDVVIGPKGSIDRFPGRLAERERWDWIDLRAYSGWRAFGFSEALDAGFTKLAAAIYDVPDAALPLMRREERRRRRRILLTIGGIATCVVAALGFLGSSLWAETKARQAVDFERRLIVAHGLIDTGDARRAVDVLAGLAQEGNAAHGAEARRALAAWSARLARASDSFKALADNQVFRWHGRNYLKTVGQLRLAFDGPPTLQSAVTKDGKRLITFDADRRFRIRDLAKPEPPLLQTDALNATTGRISELLGGRLVLFQAKSLILLSDEDMEDAQDLGSDMAVLLDPAAGTYAIQSDNTRIDVGCDRVQTAGSQTELFQGANKTFGTTLVVTAEGPALHWTLGMEDALAIAGSVPAVAAAPAPTGCAITVLSDVPQVRRLPLASRLLFPTTLSEAGLWSVTGTLPPRPAGLELCPIDDAVAADPTACYDAKRAVSTDPDVGDTLHTILRQCEMTPELLDLGDTKRLEVLAVLGNQNYGLAYCALDGDRRLDRCLAATPTARSGKRLRLQNQFLVLNGPEVHAEMFQLIDLRSLRFLKVDQPPMELLADVDFSPDATHMAALTARGEVWLYAVDRRQGTVTALARSDFGGGAEAQDTIAAEAATVASSDADAHPGNADIGAPPAEPANVFDSITYIAGNRVLLAGRRGGLILADPGAGETLWTRPAPRLLGEGGLESDAAAGVIVLHDERSVRLLSLQSGILLSNAVDVVALAKPNQPADRSFDSDRIGVQINPTGAVKLTYHDVVIEPQQPWANGLPSAAEITRRTGTDAAGHDVPLADLLKTHP